VTVQDLGRPGWISQGLSRGGAADTLALAEGAALLDQPVQAACLEMAGFGGTFTSGQDLRIALTGAPMRVALDGRPLAWNGSYTLPAGLHLTIGGAITGCYGYLHVGGGIATEPVMGARSSHLLAGIGRPLTAGDRLPLGPDGGGRVEQMLDVADRCSGGEVRVTPGLQSRLFPEPERQRLGEIRFTRDPRANRMGIRLRPDGAGFATEGGQSIVSEVIVPGDIQVPGDGAPFILLAECQTTGGYPRIGTVIPPDLPRVAQTPAGAALRFRWVSRADGLAALAADGRARAGLRHAVRSRVRDPRDIPDLLAYRLVDGATSGNEEPL